MITIDDIMKEFSEVSGKYWERSGRKQGIFLYINWQDAPNEFYITAHLGDSDLVNKKYIACSMNSSDFADSMQELTEELKEQVK